MESKADFLSKICVNLYESDLQAIRRIADDEDRDVSYILRRIVHNHVVSQEG